MKSRVMYVLIASACLLVAGSAFAAARWDYFDVTADCEGWTFDSGVKIGSSHPFIDLTYVVTLSQDGALVEERVSFFRIWMDPDVVPIYEFRPWVTDLTDGGIFDVAGTFVVPFTSDGDSVRTFAQTIDCGGGEVVCAQSPGWWRRHGDAWPVDSLVIAGAEYGKDDLIDFLHVPAFTLKLRLTRHLIAAKLNVAAGVENTVEETIAAADQFLIDHPFGTWLNGPARREGRALKNILRDFNFQGCGDKALPVASADEDDAIDRDDLYGWGEVKSMYR
ncbi:hypothetical protein KKG45_07945 [bacterium]|nr:hypothetical protein [bacterium]MBU1073164.1 hypothetical protein [bacterium]MBU1676332.1 hypothetical protein [bacterium]